MTYPWKRVVVWGPGWDKDSLRWPFFAYRDVARKLGLEAVNVADAPESREALGPGVLCITADVWSKHIGEAVPGCDYVMHNYDAAHPLRQTVDDRHWIALQVWTDECLQYEGEQWDEVRRWHQGGRTLFQPWGAKSLSEEQYEPTWNGGSSEIVFCGARWDDNGLGNEATIARLERATERRRLQFVHHTQIGLPAMIEATRSARLAPAFAGEWQVGKGYVPCRGLDNPAWGALCVTNVPRVRSLYGDAHVAGETVEELFDNALHLSSRDYIAMTKAQQAVAARYTYREGLASIARAFEAVR